MQIIYIVYITHCVSACTVMSTEVYQCWSSALFISKIAFGTSLNCLLAQILAHSSLSIVFLHNKWIKVSTRPSCSANNIQIC